MSTSFWVTLSLEIRVFGILYFFFFVYLFLVFFLNFFIQLYDDNRLVSLFMTFQSYWVI